MHILPINSFSSLRPGPSLAVDTVPLRREERRPCSLRRSIKYSWGHHCVFPKARQYPTLGRSQDGCYSTRKYLVGHLYGACSVRRCRDRREVCTHWHWRPDNRRLVRNASSPISYTWKRYRLTLCGGGISFFSSIYGLACDNVASYDVGEAWEIPAPRRAIAFLEANIAM